MNILNRGKLLAKLSGKRTVPLHSASTAENFFIVSAGRSGTTLLRRMLIAAGEVHIPPETYVQPSIIRTAARNPQLRWSELVPYALAKYQFHPEFSGWKMSLDGVYNTLLELPADQRNVARIATEIHLYHGRLNGFQGLRLGDKTPMYVFHMPTLLLAYPKARFVHLLRDGVDVVGSIMEMQRPGWSLADCAHRWRDSIRSFDQFSKRYPRQCLELRYEDLATSPEVFLRTICEFLELSFRPEMLTSRLIPIDSKELGWHDNLVKPVKTASIGKGRRTMSAPDRARLQEIIGVELAAKGYEAVA